MDAGQVNGTIHPSLKFLNKVKTPKMNWKLSSTFYATVLLSLGEDVAFLIAN